MLSLPPTHEMRIAVLLLTALLASGPSAQSPAVPRLRWATPGFEAGPVPGPGQQERLRLEWFQGDIEELLAHALEHEQGVLLSFRSDWVSLSRKLDSVSLTDGAVVKELRDLLCFQVDTDSKEGKSLRRRFLVQTPPTLVFLEPDGQPRDQLSGFLPPEALLREIRRIKRNEDTLTALRVAIRSDPDALDARWTLACKLKNFGDLAGFQAQVAEIRARDPEGRTLASRRMHLAGLYNAATTRLDLQPLYAFVAAETEPVLLFEGWLAIWNLEGRAARAARDPEAAADHQRRYFAAARALWPLVPEGEHGRLGNNIAWSFYENRACATPEDLAFALQVAEKAIAAAGDIAAVVDTYACCLFAAGEPVKALCFVERCIELDPQNPEWRERKADFLKAR